MSRFELPGGRRGLARAIAVGAALALVGAAVGVATGAIPSSTDGKIYACYSTTTAKTYLIDYQAGQRCSATNEKLVWWNQVGPSGPQGPVGPRGATGATGPVGPTGVAGATGAVGPTGNVGPTGVAGPQGDPGPTGVAGANGLDGATGPTGDPGLPGNAGPTGPTGVAGADGNVGPTGPTGDLGPTGPSGPASLAALDGSPCTVGVAESTLNVTVNPTTGAVSLFCTPLVTQVDIDFAATGGSMDLYWVTDLTTMTALVGETGVTSNITSVPVGHEIRVGFEDAVYFTYVCDVGPMFPQWDPNRSVWAGYCDFQFISSDKTVGAEFTTP